MGRQGTPHVSSMDFVASAFPPVPAFPTGLYSALRSLAQRQLARERRHHTLQPTALAHEAYLRLSTREAGGFEDRAHFLQAAAQAMRSVLVDHARRRAAEKRGGEWQRSQLPVEAISVQQAGVDVVALDESLERLRLLDPQLVQVVEMRFFGGMDDAEIAEVLRCSTRTVRRAWSVARTWLARELEP